MQDTFDDAELAAMARVLEALKPLNPEEKGRVVTWVQGKFGVNVGRSPDALPRLNQETASQAPREGTVNQVTNELGAKSCRDLLLAAAAFLSFYQGKEKFTRDEWLSCAKDARAWKSDYAKQVYVNVDRMQKSGQINEKAKDVFSLSQSALSELEAKLAK
ncbi:MAG: hypothetical protein WCD20_20465 [Rhodomicrobium sp.]